MAESAQTCVRERGEVNCPFHPGQRVVLECEECPRTLVCTSCVASTHRGHVFKELKNCIQEKVDTIEAYIRDIDNTLIPGVIADIQNVIKKLQENEEFFTKQIEMAQKHGEFMKNEADLITAMEVSRLESLLEENNANLKTYKTKLEKLHIDLESKNKEYTTTVRSGDDVLLYDTADDILNNEDKTIPTFPELNIAEFKPGEDVKIHIKTAFGEIVEQTSDEETLSQLSTIFTSADRRQRRYPKEQTIPTELTKQSTKDDTSSYTHDNASSPPTHDNILAESSTVHFTVEKDLLFKIPYRARVMCPTLNNQAWVSKGGYEADKVITLLSCKGSIQQKFKVDAEVQGMCVHPRTGQLYCYTNKTSDVRRVNTAKIKEGGLFSAPSCKTLQIFRVASLPTSLACTEDRFVVGMQNNVSMFTFTGELVHTYSASAKPTNISICSRTNKIAVVYLDGGFIEVLDNELKLIYVYMGPEAEDTTTQDKKFHPYSAVFDEQSNLIVPDNRTSKLIILVGSNGNHKHTVSIRGIYFSKYIGQRDGVFWLSTGYDKTMACFELH